MPLLFQVEQKKVHKIFYLYGTIHLPDPAFQLFSPQAKLAYQNAPVVGVEISTSPRHYPSLLQILLGFKIKLDNYFDIIQNLQNTYPAFSKAFPNAAGLLPYQLIGALCSTILYPDLYEKNQKHKHSTSTCLDAVIDQNALGHSVELEANSDAAAFATSYIEHGIYYKLGDGDELTREEAQEACAYILDLFQTKKLDLLKKIFNHNINDISDYLKGHLFADWVKEKNLDHIDTLNEIPKTLRTNVKKFLYYDHKIMVAARDPELAQNISQQPQSNGFYAFGAVHLPGVIQKLEELGYEVIPVLEEKRSYPITSLSLGYKYKNFFKASEISTAISFFMALGFMTSGDLSNTAYWGIASVVLLFITAVGLCSTKLSGPPQDALAMKTINFTLQELKTLLELRDSIKQSIQIKPKKLCNQGKFWSPTKKYTLNDTAYSTADIKKIPCVKEKENQIVTGQFFLPKAKELTALKEICANKGNVQDDTTETVKNYLTMKYRLS